MKWVDKDDNVVEEFDTSIYGFIYVIHYKSGKKYIGKKTVFTEREFPALKSGSERVNHIRFINRRKNGHIVKYEKVRIESNWRTYVGSSKEIPKEDKIVKKEILFLSTTKTTLTYLETWVLMKDHCHVRDDYYNKNILGKFYDNCLIGWVR